MKDLLPFVSSYIIDILATFLSHDYLNNLAQMAIKKEGIQSISNIIPFLDSHILSEYKDNRHFL